MTSLFRSYFLFILMNWSHFWYTWVRNLCKVSCRKLGVNFVINIYIKHLAVSKMNLPLISELLFWVDLTFNFSYFTNNSIKTEIKVQIGAFSSLNFFKFKNNSVCTLNLFTFEAMGWHLRGIETTTRSKRFV